jgi:hypothetical protein
MLDSSKKKTRDISIASRTVGNLINSIRLASAFAVMRYLGRNAGWHYAFDIVANGVSSHDEIYFDLDYLLRKGIVKQRLGAPQRDGYLPRYQYRAVTAN